MKFEQPGKLNRLMDDDISPSQLWPAIKRTAPAMILCIVLMAEMVLLKSWLRDVPVQKTLVILLVATLGVPLMIVAFAGLGARAAQRSKRTLEIRKKGLRINPARNAFLRSKDVLGFLVEPVPSGPALAKVTVVKASGKIPTPFRWWPIILDRATQVPALVSGLKGAPGWSCEFHELREPLPKSKPTPLRGLWPCMLAFYLLIHGIPLIGIGLTPPDSRRSRQEESSGKGAEKLGRLLAKHFSSVEQIRRFYLVSGGVLTGLSIASWVWGFRKMNHAAKEAWAQEKQILAAAGVEFDKRAIR